MIGIQDILELHAIFFSLSALGLIFCWWPSLFSPLVVNLAVVVPTKLIKVPTGKFPKLHDVLDQGPYQTAAAAAILIPLQWPESRPEMTSGPRCTLLHVTGLATRRTRRLKKLKKMLPTFQAASRLFSISSQNAELM